MTEKRGPQERKANKYGPIPKNPYDALGVTPSSTRDEIKRAYKILAQKYHPDTNPKDTDAEEWFRVIAEAKDILTKPNRKSKSDYYFKGFRPPTAGSYRPGHTTAAEDERRRQEAEKARQNPGGQQQETEAERAGREARGRQRAEQQRREQAENARQERERRRAQEAEDARRAAEPNPEEAQQERERQEEEARRTREATPPPDPEDTAQAEAEANNFTPEEKEQMGWGFKTLGFKVEKMKNDFFAAALVKPLSKIDKKGTAGRFFTELRNSFTRDVEEARKKGVAIQQGKDKAGFRNVSLLTGNILKYGRIVADVTGASIANPLRWAMLSSMAVARGAEAGKETRLQNEEVIEKTRIQDANAAAEEAWAIYENAQAKEQTQKVSAEALKNAYLAEMPKNLEKRLESPSTANTFVQKMLQEQIWMSISILHNKMEDIDLKTINTLDKEKAKEKLLKKWEKDLGDYDRIVTQYGTVDELAMGARYLQKGAKAAVIGMQIETAVISLEKLYGAISHILTSHDIHPIDAVGKIFSHSNEKPVGPISHGGGHDIRLPNEHPAPRAAAPLNVEHPAPNAVVPETYQTIEIDKDAIVHKGEGIENALRRQIEHDPKIATSLGFKGDVADAKALHEFSGGAAHRVALDHGYVDKETGAEIRVRPADEVAYKLKLDSGELKVDEIKVHGGFVETRGQGDKFETGNKVQGYEYKDSGYHGSILHNTEKTSVTPTPEHYEPTSSTVSGAERISKSAINPNTAAEELKARIGERIDATKTPGGTIKKGADIRTGTTIRTGTIIGTGDGVRNGEVFAGLSPNENLILQTHPELSNNPFHLPGRALIEVYNIHRNNLDHLLPGNTMEAWGTMSHLKASNILERTAIGNTELQNDSPYGHIFAYLHRLNEVTGLKPRGANIFHWKAETTEQYIARALQKAAQIGILDNTILR